MCERDLRVHGVVRILTQELIRIRILEILVNGSAVAREVHPAAQAGARRRLAGRARERSGLIVRVGDRVDERVVTRVTGRPYNLGP